MLVMPSRFEGLPLAIVEAMLCARPVVATDVAGHAEVVEDGVTGFLADAPTVGAIAAALERCWVRRGRPRKSARPAPAEFVKSCRPILSEYFPTNWLDWLGRRLLVSSMFRMVVTFQSVAGTGG